MAFAALIAIGVVVAAAILSVRTTPTTAPTRTPTRVEIARKKELHTSWRPTAPVNEGGLVVNNGTAGRGGDVDLDEVSDALIEVCTTFATSFSFGTPSREVCSRRTSDGETQARATCREHFADDAPLLETAISDGRVEPNLDELRACASSLKQCDERKALVGTVIAGRSCDDSVECVPPLICGAPEPGKQDFRCVLPREAADVCEDFILPCAKGLQCVDEKCVAPTTLAEGERCGYDGAADCADGLHCGGTHRCKPLARAGELCEQSSGGFFSARGDGSCEAGLMCIDNLCHAPVETGSACTPGRSVCAGDCDVCRPVLDGEPPVCAPRAEDAGLCIDDDDCLDGLRCTRPAGASAAVRGTCTPAAPLPLEGAACFRPATCEGDECLRCATGLYCGKGVCSTGLAGAACDDFSDCESTARCTEQGVCALLPSSGPCVENQCADGHQCVDDVCVAELAFGAVCSSDGGPRCKGENICLAASTVATRPAPSSAGSAAHCLPRRWGGEACDDDDQCQSRACLKASKVCRAARP